MQTMNKHSDIYGQVFGKLTAISPVGSNKAGLKIWLFSCDCGGQREAVASEVKRARITSCGCLAQSQRKAAGMANSHPYSRTNMYRERKTWENMIARCYVENNKMFRFYGGRGVTVCNRWLDSFANFADDICPRPDGTTLDRIDNRLGYSLDNCRWATPIEQANNKSSNRLITINGETHTVAEWARIRGIKAANIYTRLANGVSDADAVMMAVHGV
jgi:hypothetical protein